MSRLTSDPLEVVRDALLAAGCNPKGGQRITARCPAHQDSRPSLSIARGTEQAVVFKCHAGCLADDILEALRLDWADLLEDDDDEPRSTQRRVAAVYTYTDENDVALFEVVRYDPKGFAQRTPDGRWGLNGARRVPYRLPTVMAAVATGQTIYVCEGEKDVEAVERAGSVGTTNAGGALKWRDEYNEFFAGAKVVVVGDDDEAGHRHVADVVRHLKPVAAEVRTMLPVAGAKDVAEHLGRGRGLDDLRPFVSTATENGQASPKAEDNWKWSPPVPFGHQTKVPTFPAHQLPLWLHEYVVALAHATQTPVDLPGVLGLSVLAATAGGHVRLEPRPGWEEPLNLYTSVAMAPGARKTPVFMRMTRPIYDAELEAVTQAKPAVAEATIMKAIADADAAKAQAEAERAKEDARPEAVNFARAMADLAAVIEVPVMPRLLVDDATPEALASLLAEQGGQLAMFSDEGDVFSMMAGRYNKGGNNLAVYLKGHVGSPLRVDRKGRPPELIERPALTLGLTVQPEVLRQLSRIDGARGRGLLGRFLWSVPVSNVGRRLIDPTPVPADVEQRYHDEVLLMARILGECRGDTTAILTFSEDARAVLRRFETTIEPRLLERLGDLGHIADWATKLAGHTARIAGLLHLATNIRHGWRHSVQAPFMEDAVAIADYFIDHALVAFDIMSAGEVEGDARAILRWAERHRIFTQTEAHHANHRRLTSPERVRAALDLLEGNGYVRQLAPPERISKRGRAPAPRYEVNPLTDFLVIVD